MSFDSEIEPCIGYRAQTLFLRDDRELKICVASGLSELEFGEKIASLGASERSWVEKKVQAAQKRASASGFLLAHDLIALAEDQTDVIDHDSEGRPRFNHLPWDLSISNKDDFVAVAIARKPARIGIDLESFDSIQDLDLFKKNILTPSEALDFAHTMAAREMSERQFVTTLWSLKESLTKAVSRTLSPLEMSFDLKSGPFSAQLLSAGEWRKVDFKYLEIEMLDQFVCTYLVI
jgi:phosphopantetheinyl transferase